MDDGSYLPHVIAHEVAHYYWSSSGADWIDEGMAYMMAVAIENRRVGTPLTASNSPCEVVRNLRELDELPPDQREQAFLCNYSLGEGLFLSLLRTLGEDAFWEGARNLYATSQTVEAGIEEVRQAFGPDASEVIDLWYDGTP